MNRPSQPSQIIANKYRLVRRLGSGGMGSVYEAEHTTLTGRHVALKLLHEQYASNVHIAARVVREARVTATLEHPGIVRMIDVEQDPEFGPVLVMELLAGSGLDELVRSTGVSPRQAVEIVLEALDALGYAHAHNVVHRDIKPANLFVVQRPDGTSMVKIVDFGIATVLGEESLTVPGAFLGTAVYASPEQRVSATKADAVSDLYSLGMTLLRMLVADRSLLPAGSDDSRAPCADALRADHVPEALIGFALRAIEPDRAKRFATAHEMAEALRPILAIQTLSSRRVKPTSVVPGADNALGPTRPERVPSASSVEPTTVAGGSGQSDVLPNPEGTKSSAPAPSMTSPPKGRTKLVAPDRNGQSRGRFGAGGVAGIAIAADDRHDRGRSAAPRGRRDAGGVSGVGRGARRAAAGRRRVRDEARAERERLVHCARGIRADRDGRRVRSARRRAPGTAVRGARRGAHRRRVARRQRAAGDRAQRVGDARLRPRRVARRIRRWS